MYIYIYIYSYTHTHIFLYIPPRTMVMWLKGKHTNNFC